MKPKLKKQEIKLLAGLKEIQLSHDRFIAARNKVFKAHAKLLKKLGGL